MYPQITWKCDFDFDFDPVCRAAAHLGHRKWNAKALYVQSIHEDVKTTSCLDKRNEVGVVMSSQVPKWCQRQKFCSGVCHWKNGLPGLPPPGFQISNIQINISLTTWKCKQTSSPNKGSKVRSVLKPRSRIIGKISHSLMQSLAYRHIFFEVYHWENDRPGLPHPGFQFKTRFKKPLSWSKAKSFKNFQIGDSLAPFWFDARGQSCCWKMETDNFFSETKNNWRSYKSWEVATISDSEYHIQIFLSVWFTNVWNQHWKLSNAKAKLDFVPLLVWMMRLRSLKMSLSKVYGAVCPDVVCKFGFAERVWLCWLQRVVLMLWRRTGFHLHIWNFYLFFFFFSAPYWPHEGPLVQSCFTGQLPGDWPARQGWRGQGGGRGVEDLRPSCGGERGLQTTGWQRRTSLRRGWGERTTWTPEPHGLLLGVEGGWSGLWRWQACGWSWMLHCSTCLLLRCQGRPSGISVLQQFWIGSFFVPLYHDQVGLVQGRQFQIKRSVKQGDVLRPLLFNPGLDHAIRKLKFRVQHCWLHCGDNELLTDVRYADDLTPCARSDTDLARMVECLVEELAAVG